MRKRVVVYWHNGRSLGHTSECAAVMRALQAESPDVELVALTGAYHGLDLLPPDADVVRLPAYRSSDTPAGTRIEFDAPGEITDFVRRRAQAARQFLDHYRPDALLVNHLPWGWRGELTSSIEGRGQTATVLMWRGVLFDAQTTRDEYLDGGRAEWIAANYDAIVVHNDPAIFRLEDEYAFPPGVTGKLSYSGYLAATYTPDQARARELLGLPPAALIATVTMGGGQGARDIWHTVLEALGPLGFDIMRCVLGPYLEPEVRALIMRAAAEIPGCAVVSYERDLLPWLAAADVVVSAAGANALGEILATRANAIAVPRQLGEQEQDIHSALLAERGWINRIPLGDLTAGTLRSQVQAALEKPPTRPPGVLLGGAGATARRVLRLVDRVSC